MVKKSYYFRIVIVIISVWITHIQAQVIQQSDLKRPYEPVLMNGVNFPDFEKVRYCDLHLFKYQENGGWIQVPLQIDKIDTHLVFGSHDSLLSKQDELTFMAKDVGEQVSPQNWHSNLESQQHPRYEILIKDSTRGKGWVYLYRSSSIPTSNDYIRYDVSMDRVISNFYEIGHHPENGMINDMIWSETGIEFLDRVKIRMLRKVMYFFLFFDEDSLSKKEIRFIDGPVRVIRNFMGLINLKLLGDFEFPCTTKFYPYSIIYSAKNVPLVGLRLFRFSLDFNENAKGMTFYSELNSGVLIDGIPDVIEDTLISGARTWAMATGAPGTVLFIADIPSIGKKQQLYYWDNANGGSGDGTVDTGDGQSFGDFGLKITNEEVISGEFDFRAILFLLPPFQEPEIADEIMKNQVVGFWVEAEKQVFNPSKIKVTKNLLNSLELSQNYPNPFNPETVIEYSISKLCRVKLAVYDLLGQKVATLVDERQMAGTYRVSWNAQGLPGGVYFYKLEAGGEFATIKKMTLMK